MIVGLIFYFIFFLTFWEFNLIWRTFWPFYGIFLLPRFEHELLHFNMNIKTSLWKPERILKLIYLNNKNVMCQKPSLKNVPEWKAEIMKYDGWWIGFYCSHSLRRRPYSRKTDRKNIITHDSWDRQTERGTLVYGIREKVTIILLMYWQSLEISRWPLDQDFFCHREYLTEMF